ncbi:MAG: hypothetical protein R3204_15055, partial [Oceanospirillum sp.]|nr:hypothetical protein [Oceanospirillum sp.]
MISIWKRCEGYEMVAIIQVHEKNGAGETPTDKSAGAIRFKNADNAVVDGNDPLLVPTADREYSYEKWYQMYMEAPPDVSVENLRFYTDGTKNWQALVKMWARTVSAYATPGVPAETNDPPLVP